MRDGIVATLDPYKTNGLSPPEPWLSKKALAQHFNVSPRTVGTWLAAGMPHSVLGGDGTAPRMVRVRASEAEEWLRSTGRLRRIT